MLNMMENVVENELHDLYETVMDTGSGAIITTGTCIGAFVGAAIQDPGVGVLTFFTSIIGATALGGSLTEFCDIPYTIAGTVGAVLLPSVLVGALSGNTDIALDIVKAGALGAVTTYGSMRSCRATSAEQLVGAQHRERE